MTASNSAADHEFGRLRPVVADIRSQVVAAKLRRARSRTDALFLGDVCGLIRVGGVPDLGSSAQVLADEHPSPRPKRRLVEAIRDPLFGPRRSRFACFG